MDTKCWVPIKVILQYKGKEFEFIEENVSGSFELGTLSQYRLVKEINCANFMDITLAVSKTIDFIENPSNNIKTGMFSKLECKTILHVGGFTKHLNLSGSKDHILSCLKGNKADYDKNNCMAYLDNGKITQDQAFSFMKISGH